MTDHDPTTGPDSPPTRSPEAVAKVRELIEGARTAMLTTVSRDGALVTRPMATQEVEFDGDAWFFAASDSAKVAEIRADPRVNAAYSTSSFVSLSGEATIVEDVERKRELWNGYVASWFQTEPEDPAVVLIRLRADCAEYWETPNKAVVLFQVAKAKLTGDPPEVGDNHTVRL